MGVWAREGGKAGHGWSFSVVCARPNTQEVTKSQDLARVDLIGLCSQCDLVNFTLFTIMWAEC